MRFSLRAAAATLAAASLGGTALLATPATAAPAASAAWQATLTKAVTYTGTELGATPTTTPVHLALALAPRNKTAMDTALRAMYTPGGSSYRHYLTASQWRAAYAPTTSSVAAVTDYLRGQGFRNVSVTGNRLVVTADGTARQAQQAFHTSLANYRLGNRTVYGNTTPASVPASLASTVTAVIGLNNLPLSAIRPQVAHRNDAGSPDLEGGLFPAQFETTYGATGTTDGTKTSVAILSEGATDNVVSSLRYAETKEKMPKVGVTVVKVGAQSGDTAGADEFDMDSQVSTMVSGGVKHLYMYNIGSLVDAEVDADFATFVSQNKAQALSASIGGCEINSYLDGSEVSTDVVMQEGAMQGQSLFASSGDNGDACMYVAAIGAPAGVPGVNWPASGEFDTAVGGTSLISDDKGNRVQELGWLGSGGGISSVENPGWWTQASDPAFDGQYVTGGRAVPDISLDADPNLATPVKVYVGKTISFVGGTSLSSPMMLGFWARLESSHRNKLGLASIPLYRVYDKVNPGTPQTTPIGLTIIVPSANPSAVPGYTDIVAGANGTYTATPGYDLVTGLGAPDVAALDKVIAK
jgi:subtilase family serine protease